jgi:hypothetical protein
MKDELGSWGDFTGSNFLKVTSVKDENDPFVIINIEIYTDDKNISKPRFTLDKGEESFIFDCNVTNSNFCKNSGFESPRKLIGKKIYFKKVLVNSPKTNKEVESLRICKIE